MSHRGSKIYVDAIYFSKYGRYVASSTTFGLASVGDEFYLVILHAKGKTISLAYNSLMYDCKEVDNLL